MVAGRAVPRLHIVSLGKTTCLYYVGRRRRSAFGRRNPRRILPPVLGTLNAFPGEFIAMTKHDLLSITDYSARQIEALLDRARQLKKRPFGRQFMRGKTVALIFEKPSTRTSVSFASGIHALGGFPLILQSDALQWKR